jgi:hypothetical protein
MDGIYELAPTPTPPPSPVPQKTRNLIVPRAACREKVPLTDEQVRVATQMWRDGRTKPEVLEVLGIVPWRFEQEKVAGGQLAHLESRRGQRSDLRPDAGLKLFTDKPTPAVLAEVDQRRQAIQAGWPDDVRALRWMGGSATGQPARGLVSTRCRPGRW